MAKHLNLDFDSAPRVRTFEGRIVEMQLGPTKLRSRKPRGRPEWLEVHVEGTDGDYDGVQLHEHMPLNAAGRARLMAFFELFGLSDLTHIGYSASDGRVTEPDLIGEPVLVVATEYEVNLETGGYIVDLLVAKSLRRIG